jgi:ribosomal protein S18 acetylase RimI-like enzyme
VGQRRVGLIREIASQTAGDVAAFLDHHTLVHRWMVAFFRHLVEFPPESIPYWSFWDVFRGGPGRPETGRVGVVAHSFHAATTYVALAPGFQPGGIERLLLTELLPERLVGDGPAMDEWASRSPAFLGRARSVEELAVLGLDPGRLREDGVPAEGFRPAGPADGPVLREFEVLYAQEMEEEDPESDLPSLIARGLVFVMEVEGEVAGTIRSNLSDGRYVHAGGVFVHPRFRGRGLGQALVAGLARMILASGSSVVLDTRRSNEAALRSYRAAGFRDIGSGRALRFGEDAWRGGG